MTTRKAAAWGMALLLPVLCGSAFADSSYQSTTQITGGQLVDSLRSVSFLSKSIKNMFAPVSTLTMVHGNQKATVSKDSANIIDLDKEEMIHIDMARKTYSVVTFAQMRAAMQTIPEKMSEAQQQSTPEQQQQSTPEQQQQPQPKSNVKVSFNVAVKNTGASKMVNGLMAQEQIITLTVTATDEEHPTTAQGTPNTASYVVTTDAWIVPDPPEMKEISDFDRRMGEKMMQGMDAQAWLDSMKSSNAGMAQMLGSRPGASDAMAQMAKEMAKLKGTRVLEDMTMSATAPAGSATAPAGSATAPAGSSGTQTASNQTPDQAPPSASDTAEDTAANTASGKLGAIGSMLGGWHRKKAQSNSDTEQADNSVPANQTSANGTQTVVLLSMEDQKSNFSHESIPDSAFAVPVGFTQVASPYQHPQQ